MNYRSRNQDLQDSVERGLWGDVEYVDGAGSVISVRGTGTLDEEIPVLNLGYGFNPGPNANAEVVMLALGSDVNDKVALVTLPRDMQHQWGPGEGGIQSPNNPERRIEINADETWLKDGTYAIGNNKELTVTVSGGNITLATGGNLILNGDLTVNGNVNFAGGTVQHNGTDIGDTHTHGGVQVGPGNTGAPN